MTNNQYPSERAAALFNALIAALKRIEEAPESPIAKYHSHAERRELRRRVIQLRRGQMSSRFGNVVSDAELADIYDRTVQRDQTVDDAGRVFRTNELAIHRLAEAEGEAVAATFQMMFEETQNGALLHGPESEEAQRLRLMQLLMALGLKFVAQNRRGSGSRRVYLTRKFQTNPALMRLYALSAAEILGAAPADETVLTFPPEESDAARGRVVMRIGVGKASWIGSFERGNTEHNTVQLLPDGKNLFVSAGGAGYILDLQSRTLVERIGDDVVSVGDAFMGSVFIVTHDHRSFEAFGIPGRLWKTGPIGCGGFRGLTFEGEEFIGEARQDGDDKWASFAVKLATGDVSWRAACSV
jgi:hypothetical protein